MVSSVVAQRKSVDLPPPEGPMMATASPGRTKSEISRKTQVLPKDLLTCSIEKTGAAQRLESVIVTPYQSW